MEIVLQQLKIDLDYLYIFIRFYSGEEVSKPYDIVEKLDQNTYKGTINVRGKNFELSIRDFWKKEETLITIERNIVATPYRKSIHDGFNVSLYIPLPQSNKWEYFIPCGYYLSSPLEDEGSICLAEDRISYPLILAYNYTSKTGIIFLRKTLANYAKKEQRKEKEKKCLKDTDIGSIGFTKKKNPCKEFLIAYLPYYEGPKSVALDRNLSPIITFLPVDRERELNVSYELKLFESNSYEEACYFAFKYAFDLHNPKPLSLPFNLSDAIRYRLELLSTLVYNWEGYVGFRLNFDPRKSFNSPPSGFGTSFNTLQSEKYTDVLEYGFTGRQINNAYTLLLHGKKMNKNSWVDIGTKVIDSFVESCTTQTGFLYTLYNAKYHCPINPLGDERGAWLHYGRLDALEGNYIRNMCEVAYDLCLAFELTNNSRWLEPAVKFANFLVNLQNSDGSWFRAYTINGEPITSPEEWFGYSLEDQKSATPVAIPLMVKLFNITGDKRFLRSAEKAGEWLLKEFVDKIKYIGGTLDNPNIIDKESMGYSMKSLLNLYECTKNIDYLKGAARASKLAITWNYIWNVPFEPSTRLYKYDFKTSGWGGINIIWAGGVVDLYSLFFLEDWLRLATLLNEDFLRKMSELIACNTQQLLAHPGELYELCAPGTQEEGFACSNQGVDEGMIKKGDTWGSLGWIYSAGVFGLTKYLEYTQKQKKRKR